MGTIRHALIVFAARILAVLTGAELEYEVYTIVGSEFTGARKQRLGGLYNGTESECRRYIEEEIRSYHKVFYSYGVRPSGQLVVDGVNQTPAQEG